MNPKQKARRGLSHLEEAILDTLFQAGDGYMRAVDISHKIGILPSYDYGNSSRIVRQILEKMCCDGRVESRKSTNGRNIDWKLTSLEKKQYVDISSSKTIDDIIDEIKSKSTDGEYIYRGEGKKYKQVSSSLYREFAEINIEEFNLTDAEKEMLEIAENHIGESPVGPLEDFFDVARRIGYVEKFKGETIDEQVINIIGETIAETSELQLLTEVQHYGGKTNLIDFTTDYLIAIYFACSGPDSEKVGRVILLEKSKEIKNMIVRPRNPRERVIAQKSVFLQPPKGYIEVSEDDIVLIPAKQKKPLLDYLRKFHDISTESIYNDIHGFIRYQNIHQNAYVQFYMGLMFQLRALKTKSRTESQLEDYKKAIAHYNNSIKLNPDVGEAYCNRGEAQLHLQEWEEAKKDLTTARDMGVNVAASFRSGYREGVEEFEEKTNIELPSDIAELLGEYRGE